MFNSELVWSRQRFRIKGKRLAGSRFFDPFDDYENICRQVLEEEGYDGNESGGPLFWIPRYKRCYEEHLLKKYNQPYAFFKWIKQLIFGDGKQRLNGIWCSQQQRNFI